MSALLQASSLLSFVHFLIIAGTYLSRARVTSSRLLSQILRNGCKVVFNRNNFLMENRLIGRIHVADGRSLGPVKAQDAKAYFPETQEQ